MASWCGVRGMKPFFRMNIINLLFNHTVSDLTAPQSLREKAESGQKTTSLAIFYKLCEGVILNVCVFVKLLLPEMIQISFWHHTSGKTFLKCHETSWTSWASLSLLHACLLPLSDLIKRMHIIPLPLARAGLPRLMVLRDHSSVLCFSLVTRYPWVISVLSSSHINAESTISGSSVVQKHL